MLDLGAALSRTRVKRRRLRLLGEPVVPAPVLWIAVGIAHGSQLPACPLHDRAWRLPPLPPGGGCVRCSCRTFDLGFELGSFAPAWAAMSRAKYARQLDRMIRRRLPTRTDSNSP